MNRTRALRAVSILFLSFLVSGLVGFFYGTSAAILTVWLLALNISAGLAGFFWRGVIESRKRARRYRKPQADSPLRLAKRSIFKPHRQKRLPYE